MQRSSSLRAPGFDAAEFCSTKEAATMLGVSHRTVQLWVESGVLQAWKTAGGHRRITLASVNKLVDQRCEAIRPPAAGDGVDVQRKVLLVDDDATLLNLYQQEIGGWGLPLDVVTARNGFEALIKIGQARPDLLISDLSMAGMDGFRMIRTLRADQSCGNMAIILISGLDLGTIASMGLPDDIPVFSKPVPFFALRKAVDGALQREA